LSKEVTVKKKQEWIPGTCSNNANGFESEIVVAESNAAKVSNKLMEMFEQLAGKPQKKPMSKLQRWLVWLILL
jgi:hypothetical protein